MEENKVLEDARSDLKKKIWKTRKARINQSDRLINKDKIIKVLLVLYTIELLILSFVDVPIVNCTNKTIILTIIISAFSIYFASSNLLKEALILKNIYITMDQLHLKLSKANENQIKEIDKTYHNLLSLSDNHTRLDYLYAMKNIVNYDIEAKELIYNLSLGDKVKLWFYSLWYSPWIIIALWFIIPNILIIFLEF